MRALQGIKVENLAGEFRWKAKSARSTFILQDQSGPWWSLTLEPKDASTVKLTVNGKTAELPMKPQQEFRFHLFLDASVAELICNEKHALTMRIYREPDGPLKISNNSDFAQVEHLEVWQLRPISSNRLTS